MIGDEEWSFVVDKSHQFILAKLNILQVRNIRRHRAGWTLGGGGEGLCTGCQEGRDVGPGVQGGHAWVQMGPRS